MGFLNNNGLSRVWGKIKSLVATKQDTLVSGTNIKTINNTSLLGSGDISISYTGVKMIRKTFTPIDEDGSLFIYLDIPTNYKLIPYLPMAIEGTSYPYAQACIIMNVEGSFDFKASVIDGFNFILENGEQTASNIIVSANNTYICTYFVTNDDIADYDIEL